MLEIGWTVHYTSRDIDWPAAGPSWLRDLPDNLMSWLEGGLPFLLSPRCAYDVVLNSYFHRVDLIDAPWNSNANRALALAGYLNFLHCARGGKSWRQATEADHLAYHQWRRRDPAGPRVAGGTWESGGFARQPVLRLGGTAGSARRGPDPVPLAAARATGHVRGHVGGPRGGNGPGDLRA